MSTSLQDNILDIQGMYMFMTSVKALTLPYIVVMWHVYVHDMLYYI